MKPFLFISALLISSICQAQFCGTIKMQDQIIKQHPELADQIAQNNARLEKDISEKIKALDLSKLERKTDIGDTTIIIPVVVHVIHDYGSENVSDDKIIGMLNNLNDMYHLRNDTSGVIPPFKKYVGTMNFTFQFATKDPQGNPTKGITRHYSYLTYGKDNQAKLDEWNPRSYMNIWVEHHIGLAAEGGIVIAYAMFPSAGAVIPYWDGLMCAAPFLTITGNDLGTTIPHEVGHYFNLLHPWGNTNNPGKGCGDDLVDDTPPTQGEFSCNLYDTVCATGYFKLYPSITPGIDSLVDYPDTCNVQNIMNYSECTNMFTKGQVVRARAAAGSDVGGRDSLWTPFNLMRTGALQSIPDLPPIADFSVQTNSTFASISQATADVSHFMCPSQTFQFADQSWNDTIATRSWTFSNGATNPTSTDPIVTNNFSQTGWANISLTVTSNTGSNTITKDSVIYIADPTGIPAEGYYEEFSLTGDLDKWPIFNYYSDAPFKWSYSNATGFYDKSCITYTAYDPRVYPTFYIGAPQGDFSDIFSPALDLTSMATNSDANLNFMYAGTSRIANSEYMSDTLSISYSTDCGGTWTPLKSLTKGSLDNNGSLGIFYVPLSMTEWSLQSIILPSDAKTSSTFFRFRYKPEGKGETPAGAQTSNNFYMDRFNISGLPAGVNTLVQNNEGIAVAPNPTNGDAYVIIKESNSTTAQIIVTDVTGKTIYNINQQVGGNIGRIEIPTSVISAKGMYMVQVITSDQTHTEKLVVY